MKKPSKIATKLSLFSLPMSESMLRLCSAMIRVNVLIRPILRFVPCVANGSRFSGS